MRSESSEKRKRPKSSTGTEEEGLLSLLQLSDSFFPVGGYSLSFGLETLSQKGLIRSKDDVASILSTLLEQLARSDCAGLRIAYAAAGSSDLGRASGIDRRLAAFKNVRELYETSRRAGRAQLRTLEEFAPTRFVGEYRRLVERGEVPGLYPICLGISCQSLGIGEDAAVLLLLYALSICVLGAAIRLGLISHLDAQDVLHSSKKRILEAKLKSSELTWRELAAFSPVLDIMGMQHVYLSSRMFAC